MIFGSVITNKRRITTFRQLLVMVLKFYCLSAGVIFAAILLMIFDNSLFLEQKFSNIKDKMKNVFIYNEQTAVSSVDDLSFFIKNFFSGLAKSTDFPNLELEIGQKQLLQLVESNKSGSRRFVPISLRLLHESGSLELNGKARAKGDRELHWENISGQSFRVNLKNDERLFGMEEFSIQHPIIRGYTWEPFITEVFKNEGLITLQNQFVNFAVNGDRRGVYALEEVPSSLTIERNKRKSGPIFGLNEDYGTNIDSLLDPYDKKSWKAQNSIILRTKI